MRRTTSSLVGTPSLLMSVALTASLALGIVGPSASAADHERGVTVAASTASTASAAAGDHSSSRRETTLALAARALGRDIAAARRSDRERAEATLALRDLFLARPSLDTADALAADRLLARPTDDASDPYGDGYSSSTSKTCSTHVCVHYVRAGADAPPSVRWAKRTRVVMEQVWKHHVDRLGYRRPAADGSRGGNAKFDVYLKDLGSRGLYGYCAPERRVEGHSKQASGFCVLDDDFAASQFGRAPMESLRVTAAHEFFHAIQFAYDFTEDPWLLESTATWMEERFADDVNDNRAYLRYGQAARAATSLDLFEPSGLAHYGNWVWWEYLSERFGNAVVRQVIKRTGTGRGLPDDYSTQALRKVLSRKGGLPRLYAAFASANTQPQRVYDEGAAFPGVSPIKVATLRPSSPRARVGTRIDHLAAKSVRVKPRSLRGRKWRLRIKVDAPRSATAPAVSVLVVRDDGTVLRRTVGLDKRGRGGTRVRFSSRRVRSVSVTLANASTRTRCDTGSAFACTGSPRDQRERFRVVLTAFRR